MADLPLYEIVDAAYKGVVYVLPFVDKTPEGSAALLGTLGSFGSTKLAQVATKISPYVHENILPPLEKIALGAIPVALLSVGFVDQEGVREMMTQHPTYTAGMIGAAGGTMAAIGRNMYKRVRNNG